MANTTQSREGEEKLSALMNNAAKDAASFAQAPTEMQTQHQGLGS